MDGAVDHLLEDMFHLTFSRGITKCAQSGILLLLSLDSDLL
jgi:hypothetical protein